MTLDSRHRPALIALVLTLALLFAVLLTRARRPFEFMVAGTLLTSLALLGAFVVLVRRRLLR